jgi:WD40 repeat protein
MNDFSTFWKLEEILIKQSFHYKPKNCLYSLNNEYIYFCQPWDHYIRSFHIETKTFGTFAGIKGKPGFKNGYKYTALFKYPTCIVYTPCKQHIIVCDLWNLCLRIINLNTNEVSLLPIRPNNILLRPSSCTFSPDGLYLYITSDNCIQRYEVSSTKLKVFTGRVVKHGSTDGTIDKALFFGVKSCTFSPNGDFLFVCDSLNDSIRTIDMKTNNVSTFALTKHPICCEFSQSGNLIIADKSYNRLSSLNLKTNKINRIDCKNFTKFACYPTSITFTQDKKSLLIYDPHKGFFIKLNCDV